LKLAVWMVELHLTEKLAVVAVQIVAGPHPHAAEWPLNLTVVHH
jgi:hypothetical protein